MLSLAVGSAFGYSVAPSVRSQNSAGAPVARSSGHVLMADKPKIVVTGTGVVSALGSKEEFWGNLVSGTCGIGPIEAFDATVFPTHIGAEVKNFDPKPYFASPKTVKSVDRYTHMAVAASRIAVEDASLDIDAVRDALPHSPRPRVLRVLCDAAPADALSLAAACS